MGNFYRNLLFMAVVSAFLSMLFASAAVCRAQEDASAESGGVSADLLMPETVCAYFLIRDFPELSETWDTTQWGKMLQIPEMEAARESLSKPSLVSETLVMASTK